MSNAFSELLKSDVNDVFLNGDFSLTVPFTNDSETFDINIQFFESSLDKLDSNYFHCWLANDVNVAIHKDDTFLINGIVYAVVDFDIDELNQGINVFLGKVS